jgi:CubicO group peptidase (beta-lactamase class C family)
VISNSNHGYALIGQLVEDVSGRPFADYVRQEVFEALDMRRSGSLTGGLPEDSAVRTSTWMDAIVLCRPITCRCRQQVRSSRQARTWRVS